MIDEVRASSDVTNCTLSVKLCKKLIIVCCNIMCSTENKGFSKKKYEADAMKGIYVIKVGVINTS